jgi:hypothetical protein
VICHARDPKLSERVAALFGEEVLIAVAVDVTGTDQPLELFWLQCPAGEMPLQLADDLVDAASVMDALAMSYCRPSGPPMEGRARRVITTQTLAHPGPAAR